MRLIDADEFTKQVAAMTIANNYPTEKANAWCALIDAQPTAYNADKVVERLEELEGRYNSVDFGIKGIICKAIEIVKAGGINHE